MKMNSNQFSNKINTLNEPIIETNPTNTNLINLNNKNFAKNFRSKKMVCLKKPPNMSTICYMVS